MWTLSFVHTLEAMHRDNVHYFESAIQMGIDRILLQVAADIGIRLVVWTYDKVKRLWKPDVNATHTVLQLKDQSEAEMSPLQQANLDERFAAVRADPDDDDIAECQASQRPLTPEEKLGHRRTKRTHNNLHKW